VYFLRVSSPAAPGPYQVQALLTSDIDLDSSAANAWTLTTDATSGRVLGSRFETGSDADDWYQFTAAAEGDWFLVETFGLGPGVGTTLELYTPPATLYGRTGTIDSMPDSSGGNGLGHWMLQNADGALINGGARIAFQAPVPGTYYVRVKNRYATAGRYYLAFDDAGQVLRTGWLTGSMGFP
jgi:hypothetical protein